MTIHLDTGFLIRALKAGSPEDRKLRGWVETGEMLVMSAVAWAEFLCGPLEESEQRLAAQIVGRRAAFSEEQAATAAQLFNESGRRRGSLVDCMVAAAALDEGAPVATTNEADFRRFQDAGLEIA